MKFKGQRKAGPLRLTRENNGNDRSGPFVENVLAQDQNWTLSGLFSPPYRIHAGPADLNPEPFR